MQLICDYARQEDYAIDDVDERRSEMESEQEAVEVESAEIFSNKLQTLEGETLVGGDGIVHGASGINPTWPCRSLWWR